MDHSETSPITKEKKSKQGNKKQNKSQDACSNIVVPLEALSISYDGTNSIPSSSNSIPSNLQQITVESVSGSKQVEPTKSSKRKSSKKTCDTPISSTSSPSSPHSQTCKKSPQISVQSKVNDSNKPKLNIQPITLQVSLDENKVKNGVTKKTKNKLHDSLVNSPDTSGAIALTKKEKKKAAKNAKDNLPDTKNRGSSSARERVKSPDPKNRSKEITKNRATALLKAAKYRFNNYMIQHELENLSSYGALCSGTIRINHRFVQEAYVTLPDGQDIIIKGVKDRNRALNGDEVYLLIKPTVQERKAKLDVLLTGVVVSLKTLNHNRVCIGSLSPFYDPKKDYAMFLPHDMRLPRLRIHSRLLPPEYRTNPMLFQDQLFATRLVLWNVIDFAIGGELNPLGSTGNVDAQMKAILLKYNLDVNPYPEYFNRFYPPLSFTIPNEEVASRLDLRKECIFTIDPATAKDLDDAVSCQIQEDGNYLIGVHIADVSYFLKEGTDLDNAVAERATTVYLVDSVYHMLPRDLCSLCSLTPGVDKLAFSVFWEFSPEGKILSNRFARTVINSCAQLSYEQVQDILDDEEPVLPLIENGFTINEIRNTVQTLHRFAQILRAERVEAGALRLDQVKISFILDPETRLPKEYHVQENLAAHRLIEEFMLLANGSVAKTILEFHPDHALLRCHPDPHKGQLVAVQQRLESYGLSLDTTSSKTLQSSLTRICEDSLDQALPMVVFRELTKPMPRALYFCSKFREFEDRKHFALSIPLYTHFTSPIRRYADVIVHRLLASALQLTSGFKMTPEKIEDIAGNCNKMKYNAKIAGDESIELYFALYVGSREPLVQNAAVCFISSSHIECLLIDSGILIKVSFEYRRLTAKSGNTLQTCYIVGTHKPTKVILRTGGKTVYWELL